MAIQYSTAVRNARLDSLESTVGTSAILKIFDGTLPANCAAADNGTVVAEFSLPSDWMAAASGGQKAKSGTWQETSANASGSADYFRVYDSGGSTCHMQGTVGQGAGDLSLDNTTIVAGQQVTVNSFTITEGNP